MPDTNRDTRAALAFHAATKYVALGEVNGEQQYAMGTPPALEPPLWEQDWSIDPRVYKVYTSLPPLPLPPESSQTPTSLPALEAIASTGAEPTLRSARRSSDDPGGSSTEHPSRSRGLR